MTQEQRLTTFRVSEILSSLCNCSVSMLSKTATQSWVKPGHFSVNSTVVSVNHNMTSTKIKAVNTQNAETHKQGEWEGIVEPPRTLFPIARIRSTLTSLPLPELVYVTECETLRSVYGEDQLERLAASSLTLPRCRAASTWPSWSVVIRYTECVTVWCVCES